MNKPALARRQRGTLAVEAAFVLPVVIAGAMMFMELANIGLTINIGASALERAVAQFRQSSVAALLADADGMEASLRRNMAQASHDYLTESNISVVEIVSHSSLDAMGGGSGQSGDDTASSAAQDLPAWRITVDIRKDFITPLPALLGVDSDSFRYRYEQVLAYLPPEVSAQ